MARRGRPAASSVATIPVVETPVEAEAPAPVKRRRRRRTPAAPETVSETTTLIRAVLRSRGIKGATSDVLQHVISWAYGIREEADELRTGGTSTGTGRGRRAKVAVPTERLARHEMNRALLEGVLDGSIYLQVSDEGGLLFIHSDATEPVIVPAVFTAVPLDAETSDAVTDLEEHGI